jgi:hypothetical protein
VKTPKGTDLPILSLRGKDYLEVKYRIVWFREDRPTWSIETELISVMEKSCLCKATIKDDVGRIIATSHKFENVQGFGDFIEKSETGAIGRALALCGYGTQFCADELDEADRIVDSPAKTRAQIKPTLSKKTESKPEGSAAAAPKGITTEYKVPFGKKFQGKALKEIPEQELRNYANFIVDEAEKNNQEIKGVVKEFLNEVDSFLGVKKELPNLAAELIAKNN